MAELLLAGLDIGTTNCKISVFQTNGRLLDSIYQNYPVRRDFCAHEVDAGAIWTAVQEVVSLAAKKYPYIVGIGVTSFGETFAALDENDIPLLPSMLNTDPRGKEQCEQLVSVFGKDRITAVTGLNPNELYSLPKLMWIKETHPNVYAKIKHVLLMEDYIVYMLTGNAQIDYSLAARTMAFDIHRLSWSEEIFSAAGIDSDLFSRPVPTGTSAGKLRKSMSEYFGLSKNTVVVSVGHDQVAAAIGCGVLDESAEVDGAGTVQCNTPVFKTYDAVKMAKNNYCIVPFIKPGSYVTYAFSYSGGALIKWFVGNLAGYAANDAVNGRIGINQILEGNYKRTPTGILVLPHFAGAATPYMDSESRGAVVGLTLSHTQQDIYCAIMEGVCYEMRLNQERLAEAGVKTAPLRAAGGGTKSRVWMQMKADVLNVPVTAMTTGEAGAVGSAMLTGINVGVFGSLEEAASVMVKECETFYPEKEAHDKYEAVYRRYKKLYEAVRPLV